MKTIRIIACTEGNAGNYLGRLTFFCLAVNFCFWYYNLLLTISHATIMQEEEYAYILTLTWKSVHWIYLNFARKQLLKLVQLKLKLINILLAILCMCRSPSADFDQVLEQLDLIVKYSYKPNTEFVLCGI
jgi:hypothetical protein